MNFIRHIYQTIVDSLFPLTDAEHKLFSYTPEQALARLPPAPAYDHPMPDTFSIFAYKDERVAKLVWNVKYKKSSRAVAIGGWALWEMIRKINSESFLPKSVPQSRPSAPIIPMPITSRRRKERGYNQCELLLDEIERLVKETAQEHIHYHFEKKLLIRTQHTSRQTLKGRSERLESAKGIFAVDEHVIDAHEKIDVDFRQRHLILIDDVITTGSTATEARETLVKAGFTRVSLLSLAH